MDGSRFVGAWRMRSIKTYGEDGEVKLPYGDEPGGFIMYTPDGYMSATIMRAGREAFPAEEYRSASVEEQARALRSYLAYAGPYEIESETRIVHHVEASLLPNWIGGDQVRHYHFEENTLTLSTHPIGDETPGRTVIDWERA